MSLSTRRTFVTTLIAFAASLLAGVPFIERWLLHQQWKCEVRKRFFDALCEESVVPFKVIDPLMCVPTDPAYGRRVYYMLRRRRKQK